MILSIVVPVSGDQAHLLDGCLQAIKKNTQTEHEIILCAGGSGDEDRAHLIVNSYYHVYKQKVGRIHVVDPELGYNGAVEHGLRDASGSQYVAVVPATVRLGTQSWFAKLQSPLLRAGAMSVFPDDANDGSAPTVSMTRRDVESLKDKGFLLDRRSLEDALKFPIDFRDHDIANSLARAFHGSGKTVWMVNSVRSASIWAPW